ncbi:hypothetical protein SCHPADRAFT_896396 [Schizopora paradoxa]|uniref:Uncharacterized protein n=1 Tax=Schizopora paradoxa TaxID=27342 RepID=A0A0H2RKD4_9AGAM|nr:hypothetical protein SCHPADRAFT_896396 [Schizopora paradoxa]
MHIVRVALGGIRRAMPDFNANGDGFILSSFLHVLFLLYEVDDTDVTAFERSLRDAFLTLNGVRCMEDILRATMEHSSWVSVNIALGIVSRHFCAVPSSRMIKKSLDIRLIKMVLEVWKKIDILDPVARYSLACLVQDHIPETFLLHSVVRRFDVRELRSSLADVKDDGWQNILLLHQENDPLNIAQYCAKQVIIV